MPGDSPAGGLGARTLGAGLLWEQGRVQGLIEPLNDGRGQGYAAWRVLPAPAEWEQVVQAGLAGKAISF